MTVAALISILQKADPASAVFLAGGEIWISRRLVVAAAVQSPGPEPQPDEAAKGEES